ncbi:MAG: acyltransferase family protein [Muribaculaceae bacterium]
MSAILLTALIPLSILFLAIYKDKTSVRKPNILDKDLTNALKGFAAIIVIMVHIPEPEVNPLQDAIGSFAYVAVTFFFFVSAYGTRLSLTKNPDYLKRFWPGRLLALLIPMLLCNVVYFATYHLPTSVHPAAISLLYAVNPYVTVLLCYYLFFYLAGRLAGKLYPAKYLDPVLWCGIIISSSLCYVSELDFTWCYEQWGLIWGLLAFKYKQQFINFISDKGWVKICSLLVISGILGVMYLKFKHIAFWGEYLLKIGLGFSLLLTMFAVLQGWFCENRISRRLGKISYEVYLLHGAMFAAALYLRPANSGVFILYTVALTLIGAAIMRAISTPLIKMGKRLIG